MAENNFPLKDYGRLLLHYLRPQKWQVVWLALLIVAGIALQLLNPQLVRRFLDGVEAGQTVNQLLQTAAAFTAVAILAQFLKLLGTYIGENVAWTATNALRADLASHCLRLDMAFHKTHKPGELIERVDGDVNQLANFFSQLVIQLVSNLLLVVGVVALLWLVDWRVGVTMTAVALAGMVVLNTVNRHVVPRWQALRAVEADMFGYLEEWLSGRAVVQTNNAAPFLFRRLVGLMRQRWHHNVSAMRLNLVVMTLPIVVPGLAYLGGYLWGDALFRASVLTIGSVYLIFYYIDTVRNPLWAIQRQIQDLQRAAASLNRIIALFNEQPTLHDGTQTDLPAGPMAVQFAGVSFAYDDEAVAGKRLSISSHQSAGSSEQVATTEHRPPITDHGLPITDYVLHDITFTLAPGRVLGLLGRTGSGKSTITRLLFRFYDPTAGEISLGSNGRFTPLPATTQAAIRQRIGLVTQEVQLFHASVRDNLTLFDDTVPDDNILAALDKLGLRPWLDSLPNGLNTKLAGSSNLSAGEAQLLALGRVFLRDPGLVILDEASSRLDPATEQLLERAVDRLLAGRTAIIIAHRLATVQRADEIMVLANGRIVEHGPRQTLAIDPTSHFYHLLQTGLEQLPEGGNR